MKIRIPSLKMKILNTNNQKTMILILENLTVYLLKTKVKKHSRKILSASKLKSKITNLNLINKKILLLMMMIGISKKLLNNKRVIHHNKKTLYKKEVIIP